AAVKAKDPDALILGEVWEDASNKASYGKRRRYLLGRQLDSVMNYPFAEAILTFIRSGKAEGFSDQILNILENYPKCVSDILMNHIGTHDTMRAITALAGESCEYRDRAWQSKHSLSKAAYAKGVRLLQLAAVAQYTLPGVPSLYYGDEAGMEGYKDPFNRVCYPWGNENRDLLSFYRALGQVRKGCDCLKDGTFHTVSEMLSCLAFERANDKDEILVILNRNEHPITYHLPDHWHYAACVFGGKRVDTGVSLDALDSVILRREK
ncbi:MAG: glycoside hydrolase family 13 protein, partial [Clostridia bacterium]|nr:glycoside hydrolase family 13 protein [Clostridia bacterium]